jgi:uncharacterized membrane protein YcaP (DUF421 family)
MEKILEVKWDELFVPYHSLAEMFVRGTIMYLALFLILRFLMKRQAGSIGIADILVIVIIADAAQNAFAKEYRSITEGIVLIVTIVGWDFTIDWLSYRFPRLQRFVQPPPLLLIKDGNMILRNMRREYITVEELESQLRLQGVDHIQDVRTACMEGDGQISVVKKGK